MHNATDLDYGDSDPLALQTESFLIIEYGEDCDDKDATLNKANLKSQPLRRSKRCISQKQEKIKDCVVEDKHIQPELFKLYDKPGEVGSAGPLFPITKRMRERIKRMKQRMLATLKLSDEQLVERRLKRAKQTKESRRRAACADAAYRTKETNKKIARTKAQREMEMAVRMAKKREEGRRYLAKRRQAETPEQKAARQEYQRLYSKNRKPIKFV